jgi:hypothetical protein
VKYTPIDLEDKLNRLAKIIFKIEKEKRGEILDFITKNPEVTALQNYPIRYPPIPLPAQKELIKVKKLVEERDGENAIMFLSEIYNTDVPEIKYYEGGKGGAHFDSEKTIYITNKNKGDFEVLLHEFAHHIQYFYWGEDNSPPNELQAREFVANCCIKIGIKSKWKAHKLKFIELKRS